MTNQLKYTLIFLSLFLFLSNKVDACMIVYFPNNLANEHDLLFTAKVQSCHAMEDNYIHLKVMKLWKGKNNEIYRIKQPCSEDYFEAGRHYLIVANSTDTEDIIEIPAMQTCRFHITSIDMDLFSHFHQFAYYIYIGNYRESLNYWLSIAIRTGDKNLGLGEPLYVYSSNKFIDKYIFKSYLISGLFIFIPIACLAFFIILLILIHRKIRMRGSCR